MISEIERLNKLLGEVGRRHDIELKLNHEGTGGLELKNGIKLFFEYVKGSGKLYIYTPLETISRDDPRRLALYEAMLDCNFLNIGCETGALAIFRHTEQAVYQTGMDAASLNAERLGKAIDELIDQRDEVVYQLDQAKAGKSKTGKSGDAGADVSTLNRLALHMRQR
jgi:hypothetical protein